jgi:uncharacterized protein with PQ loop repeat
MPLEVSLSTITWLVGGLSGLLSIVLMFNPLPRILEITAKNNEHHQINKQKIALPPFIALFANYCIWKIYGFIIKNPIIFFQNLIGVAVSSFYLYRLFFSNALTLDQKVGNFFSCCLHLFLHS